MSQMMLSTCGLDCNTCPARMAFLHDDPELRRRTAEEWSKAYNVQISADAVFCSGCRVADGPKIGHCGECEVRLCGIAHGVATCGECADYPGCPTIAKYLEMMPGNRERLDAARAAR